MKDNEKRRLLVAFALAKHDCSVVSDGDEGLWNWGRRASYYLELADKAIAAADEAIDDGLVERLKSEIMLASQQR